MYSKVVQHLNDYLDGSSSKHQFEEWLYDLAFDVEETQSERVIALVHELEGILAEASSGNWAESVLQIELRAALQQDPATQTVFSFSAGAFPQRFGLGCPMAFAVPLM